jgi:hypothetical protein
MATQLLGRIIRICKMTIMLLMMMLLMKIDDGGDINVDYYVDHYKDSDNKDNNDHAEIRDAPLYITIQYHRKDKILGQFVQNS